MNDVSHKGYGIFARYHVFTLEDGHLTPVKYPDPQRLDQLPGYEREREKVIANTKALLAGQPANNVLLYGDAGTGKSSSIKAIANEFAAEGLRLVEIKKNQLYQLPELMDSLAANPLKFILFIDDLSFTANDDNFAALKAILEGSVGGRSQNLVVYATSNRPPSHQRDHERPGRGRHSPRRHHAGADEPVGPVWPDGHVQPAGQGALRADRDGAGGPVRPADAGGPADDEG